MHFGGGDGLDGVGLDGDVDKVIAECIVLIPVHIMLEQVMQRGCEEGLCTCCSRYKGGLCTVVVVMG